jgi:hypothetical protein
MLTILLVMLNHRYHHALSNVQGDQVGEVLRYSFAPQVLEPNWHLMHDRLQTARSIDEVLTEPLQLLL